jgi:hypothetical protein
MAPRYRATQYKDLPNEVRAHIMKKLRESVLTDVATIFKKIVRARTLRLIYRHFKYKIGILRSQLLPIDDDDSKFLYQSSRRWLTLPSLFYGETLQDVARRRRRIASNI